MILPIRARFLGAEDSFFGEIAFVLFSTLFADFRDRVFSFDAAGRLTVVFVSLNIFESLSTFSG